MEMQRIQPPRGLLLGAITLLLLFTLHPSGSAAQNTGSIRGSVVSATSGEPLSDVDVFLEGLGRRGLTNRTGGFLFAGLSGGRYHLVAERVGFGTIRQEVEVRAGGTTEIVLRMEDEAISIPEVIVIATREAKDLSEVAASVGVVSGAQIRETNPGHPSEIMGQVPGVYVNVTGGEGHMTAIRQPLSTDPLYLYLEDGVPTRSTGFFNHNALYEVNLPQADRIEVMKGPANALYGSDAIGGVINVGTRAPSEERTGELSLEGGQFGFQRYLGSLSGTRGSNALRADVNVTRTDGWRDGTDYVRYSGTFRWDRALGSGASLKTVVAYSNIDQNTAGSSAISLADFDANPEVNYTPISFRKVTALRVSSQLLKRTDSWSFEVTPFGRINTHDLLPNWSLTFDPTIYETGNRSLGLLAKATYRVPNADASLTVGADFDYSPGDRLEWIIAPTRTGSIFTSYTEGSTVYDYDVTFREVAPYLHGEWTPSDRVHLSGGLRADLLSYDYVNHLSVATTGRHRRPADAAPSFNAVSPKLGITVEVMDGLDAFTSYRKGFRAPSEGQLFRQGSAVNTIDLKPVKVDSYEAGIRGRAGHRVSYEVSAYTMTKTDDILSFRHSDGTTESVNAGETLSQGIELGLGVQLAPAVRLDAAYSFAEHTYEDWEPQAGGNLSGKTQEFAPNQIGNARLSLAPNSLPFTFSAEWSRIGSYWMDAANTNEYEGHDLLNLRASFDATERIEVFGRLNNATDERYAERASFTTARGQELSPGMPRTLYLGVRVR